MSHVAHETFVTLREAARRLKVSPRTIRRWATVGVNGKKLEVFRAGRVMRTTWSALDRFQSGYAPRGVVSPELNGAQAEAERLLLKRYGIKVG